MPKKRKSTKVPPIKEYTSICWNWMKQFDITQTVIASFKLVFESWGLLFLGALLDFLFLFTYSGAVFVLYEQIFGHLYQLLMLVGESTGGLIKDIQDPMSSSFLDLAKNPTFTYHMGQVATHLLLLFVMLVVLWCIFEGAAWFIAHKLKGKHEKKRLRFTDYIATFLTNSILYFLILLSVFWYFIQKFIEVGLSLESAFTKEMVLTILWICVAILAYFAFVAYARGSTKPFKSIIQSIKFGVMKFPKLVPVLVFLAVFHYLVNWLLYNGIYNLTQQNFLIMLLYGLVIFLPTLTFSRVVFIKAVQSIKKD